MYSILITIAVVYLAVLVLMYVAQRQLMYQPGKMLPPASQTEIPDAITETTTTDTGVAGEAW